MPNRIYYDPAPVRDERAHRVSDSPSGDGARQPAQRPPQATTGR